MRESEIHKREKRVGEEEGHGWAKGGRAEGKPDRVAGGRRDPQVKKTKEKRAHVIT